MFPTLGMESPRRMIGHYRRSRANAPSDTKSKVYTRFRKLAELIPELRAGQLIAAVGGLCADLHGHMLCLGRIAV